MSANMTSTSEALKAQTIPRTQTVFLSWPTNTASAEI